MTPDDLMDFVTERGNLSRSQLRTDSPLFSSGILDSMSVLELTSFVEKRASIRFAAAEIVLENLDSVDRIMSFVKSKRPS